MPLRLFDATAAFATLWLHSYKVVPASHKLYLSPPVPIVIVCYNYISRFPEMGVPPKSSILMGFSIINQPFWVIPHLHGNPQYAYGMF